ncbi:bifunctional 4-hydroxy-2-oxoglutarate aldolase/2-dehydro-3-deoxy-phosphogluconate aldolase [Pontibacter diazotrophicus]|uniref:Bifunctional 4-hydroxy-2-oxoglutarate aldolase/2-dehydro-3-deoxy-phosphogluconate aldolase n=1 Tax=Pontibacter diazotrophicus TaxID=1400979 RepID=A0A3D8LHH3_9BACT|nr:bifunctional 4-hydroxy-2-oxoglutarate aldolase/2-dehydro-3-deoxy-phosphogluconate aldolase [Pontibacter diazotrophicus]RDV16881.1 bifunctional 4-hydroxy-2-oxoglutarate aldolase/2-dehydro-3-deoxy-phosphogluconate aldolase [Pontibacter diazotrophicus]
MKSSFSWEAFDKIPVVGILRNVPSQHLQKLFAVYLDAGLTTIEVTMNSAGATEAISSLVKTYGDRLNIGAGTVCTLGDLDKALLAGAQFIVTPILNEEVIKACVARNVPVFAGAYTPTEIYRAWELGASMVKVFPAGQLGARYIKEVLAPLNQIKLLPTGGISHDNFAEFLEAGASGLGMGSQLIPKALVEKEQWEELSKHLSEFVEKYHSYKQQHA